MILKSDLKQITYQEFGEILDSLEKRIVSYCQQNSLKFDLIVPILRSGAFTGMHLASKLKIKNILPTQYKYEFNPNKEGEIVKKFELPKLCYELPESINILITDSNTVFGAIAQKVINDVKGKFPKSKIYFASANLDQSTQKMNDVEQVFYGSLSNEKRELDTNMANLRNITNDVFIFPWENLEEQWEEINASQQ